MISKPIVYAIIVVALLLAVVAMVAGIYHKGYSAGEAEIKSQWEAADRKAQDQADAARKARELIAQQTSTALQQSQAKADDYAQKWQQARRAARSVPLAVCGPRSTPPPKDGAPATVASPDGGIGLRLTWSFVLQHDAAWSGDSGQPIFPDTGLPPGGAAAADPAPYEIGDLLDHDAINAQRCSEDGRNYGALVKLIRKLQAAK